MGIDRSENMRRIRSKDTLPEIAVRRLVRQLGHTGYRLHRKDLPGKPDIAFLGRKTAIFVHGCFWHGHECKEGIRRPKSNGAYWLPKIDRNIERDAVHIANLQSQDWSVLVVWECDLLDMEALAQRLGQFLTSQYPSLPRKIKSRTSAP
jgi:DNA mismatch endonuclease (patch repair protein)